MPGKLFLPGTTIANWPGVQIFQRQNNVFVNITNHWNWSTTPHPHYQVRIEPDGGSYWVPASTTPPTWWPGPMRVTGEPTPVTLPVNPGNDEYRPQGTYIYIPYGAIPVGYGPSQTGNWVRCRYPHHYPPVDYLMAAGADPEQAAMANLSEAHRLLSAVVGGDDKSKFQDSDGLISFVNLSSDFVAHSPTFTTGQTLCDMIANFYATLRPQVFARMKQSVNPLKPLQGDAVPGTQWDKAVTHMMQYMLQLSGGLTDYSITTETYSDTQVVAEFSTSFLKLIFDAMVVPENVISSVTAFISGVGESLRIGWDDRKRDYSIGLLGQCHEAVQQNTGGPAIYRYYPKIKYYYLSVSASQSEFTSDCATVRKITFNFQYESYVTAIAAAALDKNTKTYGNFFDYLTKAQTVNYQNANNLLNEVLNGTTSQTPSPMAMLGANLDEYPSCGPAAVDPGVSDGAPQPGGHRLIPA